jgi:hypothetical protein
MNGPTIKRTVHFAAGRRGARKLKTGEQPKPKEVEGPVPREARLMAFAIVFDEWLASGKVADYAELSAMTGFDRSRITRIMNYRLLAPKEQERLLRYSSS